MQPRPAVQPFASQGPGLPLDQMMPGQQYGGQHGVPHTSMLASTAGASQLGPSADGETQAQKLEKARQRMLDAARQAEANRKGPGPATYGQQRSGIYMLSRRGLSGMSNLFPLQRGFDGNLVGPPPDDDLVSAAKEILRAREAFDFEFNMAARSFGPQKAPHDAFALDSGTTDVLAHESILEGATTSDICVDKAGGAWGMHQVTNFGEILMSPPARQLMPVVPLMTNAIADIVFRSGALGPIVAMFDGWRRILLDLVCDNVSTLEIQNNLVLLPHELSQALRMLLAKLHAEEKGTFLPLEEDVVNESLKPIIICPSREKELEKEVATILTQMSKDETSGFPRRGMARP